MALVLQVFFPGLWFSFGLKVWFSQTSVTFWLGSCVADSVAISQPLLQRVACILIALALLCQSSLGVRASLVLGAGYFLKAAFYFCSCQGGFPRSCLAPQESSSSTSEAKQVSDHCSRRCGRVAAHSPPRLLRTDDGQFQTDAEKPVQQAQRAGRWRRSSLDPDQARQVVQAAGQAAGLQASHLRVLPQGELQLLQVRIFVLWAESRPLQQVQDVARPGVHPRTMAGMSCRPGNGRHQAYVHATQTPPKPLSA